MFLSAVGACVAFWRRPAFVGGAVIMLFTGFIARSIHTMKHPLLAESITDRWSCLSLSGKGSVPLLECTNPAREHFIVEWKENNPPDSTRFLGNLRPLQSSSPAFLRWKHRQGIVGRLRPLIGFCPSHVSSPAMSREKEWLWNHLQNHFTQEVPGLLFAITSGDKRHLSVEVKRLFNHAGLSHLMAVSGYHVVLVASWALFLMRRRGQGARLLGFIGLSFAWAFVGFCGWPDSALRAGVMITVYGVSQLAREKQSPEHAMAFAGWWMLLIDPSCSVDLGTQLSFLAVFAILMTIQMLQRTNAKRPAWLLYIFIPISAQWGTGLVAWPQFQLFPVHFLIFNLLASPIMTCVGIVLATLLMSEYAIDTSCWLETVAQVMNRALLWGMDSMERLHTFHWTLNLERIQPELLAALSLVFWLAGGAMVYADLAPRRALRYALVGFVCLAPIAAWQLNHCIGLEFRHGMVLHGAGRNGGVWTEMQRDSATITRKRINAYDDPQSARVIGKRMYHTESNGDWLLAFQNGSGFGQQKSRPFAWKRMGGSSMRFILGTDTVWLDKWAGPANWDVSLGAGGW